MWNKVDVYRAAGDAPGGGGSSRDAGTPAAGDNQGGGGSSRDTAASAGGDAQGGAGSSRDTAVSAAADASGGAGSSRDTGTSAAGDAPGNTGESPGRQDRAGHRRQGPDRAGRPPDRDSSPDTEPAALEAGRYVVDRIEEGYAVLIADDGGATVTEPAGNLPDDAREGSCVVHRRDGSFVVDHARTADRKAQARARLEALRARSRRNR